MTLCCVSVLLSTPLPTSAQTADAYRNRATELSRTKSWDEAIANFRKAIELEPDDSTTHYNLGLALKYKGDTPEALKELQMAIKLRPKWAEAHQALGSLLYDSGNETEAISELRLAESTDPSEVATHRLLARILSRQSNLADADREIKTALRLKPSADTYVEAGVVQGELGNLTEAAAHFRRAIQLDARLPSARLMLGIVLRRQGNHKGALDQFQKAVELRPDDADAQYNLGRELKGNGNTQGAIAAFRRAIEARPDFEQAHYNLALALHKQGDVETAQKEVKELSGLHDFRARLAQSKMPILQGVDALKNQKLDDALALFQRSQEQSPELPTSQYYLGLTWEVKND
ncbi:MAG TPA: tetratricopeptide repeat protein, partial [Candidatus Acidoferrum sp.]|nr:tetratricopeptide repeat protein [Candidatus Acidoferrum sp.]